MADEPKAISLKPPNPQERSNPPVEPRPGLDAEEERVLVRRSQAGDQRAFRVLVERHRDRAYGLALRILRMPLDAEEVTQDAFVRAWLALPRFRGEARFSTWLHRIVARRAFDRAQALRLRREREIELDPVVDAVSAGVHNDVDESAIQARRIDRLLSKLSESQRAVVTLFYYQDRSIEQVAGILGMASGTVKTHLSRARAALRGAMIREQAGES